MRLPCASLKNPWKTVTVFLVITILLMFAASPMYDSRISSTPAIEHLVRHSTVSDEEGPVFSSWNVPHGGMNNGTIVGVSAVVRDQDGIDTVLFYSLSPWIGAWDCRVMEYQSTHSSGVQVYHLTYRVYVLDTGASVTYVFRFEANDTLGNWGVTENLTVNVHMAPIPDSPTGNNPLDPGLLLIWIGVGTAAVVLAIAVCYTVKRRVARP